jgi:hypothetical protein
MVPQMFCADVFPPRRSSYSVKGMGKILNQFYQCLIRTAYFRKIRFNYTFKLRNKKKSNFHEVRYFRGLNSEKRSYTRMYMQILLVLFEGKVMALNSVGRTPLRFLDSHFLLSQIWSKQVQVTEKVDSP